MGLYNEETVRSNVTLRWIGFLLLFMAIFFLMLDCYLMIESPRKALHFSALKNILVFCGMPSMLSLKYGFLAFMPDAVMDYVLIPFTELPIVSLAIPGIFLLRRYAPPVKVRPPSGIEMEMLKMGTDPRRIKRQR